MTLPTGNERQKLASKSHFGSQEKAKEADTLYVYHDAGLVERHGYVPYWLKLVAVVLIIWSVYYLLAYWTPPA
jgi:hypothetical protein